jgi:hypothetical protein
MRSALKVYWGAVDNCSEPHFCERRRGARHRRYGGQAAMSVTDQLNESLNGHNNNEPRLVLDLELSEAQALRAWLLETEVNGLSAQDTPIVSAALSKLGRAVDTAQATINIRREFQQAGVNLAHWSDEQVLELGRRIAEAARPILQS